jgi:hypothetical protein
MFDNERQDIERRHKSQLFLLELRQVHAKHRDVLGREPDIRVLLLLIGAGYSLWRAAFLAVEQRSWEKLLSEGDKLLCQLITTNSITFQGEVECKHWTGNYYLNNARYRMVLVRSLLLRIQPAARTLPACLEKFDTIEAVDMQVAPVREKWAETFEAANAALDHLLELRDILGVGSLSVNHPTSPTIA